MPHTLLLSHVENVYRQLSDPANPLASARAWRRDARSQGSDGLQKLQLLFEVAGWPGCIESIGAEGTRNHRVSLREGVEIDPVALQNAVQSMAPRSGFSASAVHAKSARSIGERLVDWLAHSGIGPLRQIAVTYQMDRNTRAAVRAQNARERGAAHMQGSSERPPRRAPAQAAQYQEARYAAGAPSGVPTSRGLQPPGP